MIISTLSFPTLRNLRHIQSQFLMHTVLTPLLEELNGFTCTDHHKQGDVCHENKLKYCNMASRENPFRHSTFIKQKKTKASVQKC